MRKPQILLTLTVALMLLLLAACRNTSLQDNNSINEPNTNSEIDISAKAMQIHELLRTGLSIAELEAELGVAAENILSAYDGRPIVYRFNIITMPNYKNPAVSDGDIDWHGLRDGLVRIIAHIQYETFIGNILHSVIYSPSEGRAYIIGVSGERTDVSDMLDTPPLN